MTIQEAVATLVQHYVADGLYGTPSSKVEGVQVDTYDGREAIVIHVRPRSPGGAGFIPSESKPGVGWEGFECASYRGSVFLSDSGPIPS